MKNKVLFISLGVIVVAIIVFFIVKSIKKPQIVTDSFIITDDSGSQAGDTSDTIDTSGQGQG